MLVVRFCQGKISGLRNCKVVVSKLKICCHNQFISIVPLVAVPVLNHKSITLASSLMQSSAEPPLIPMLVTLASSRSSGGGTAVYPAISKPEAKVAAADG